MPNNYTQNYQLNQWEATDQVKRTDFNADNAKIDAALTALSTASATIPKVAVGSYTGDGARNQTISVGFTPKAVLLFTVYGNSGTGSIGNHVSGGLAVTGNPLLFHWSGETYNALEVVSGGFRVGHLELNANYSMETNSENAKYTYIAIG